jgi:cell division septation protein DedD
MSFEGPREPRFDTTPAPRIGAADPLRAPPEPEEAPPAPAPLGLKTLGIGVGLAVALAVGIVWATHRGSEPAPPAETPAPAASAASADSAPPAPDAAPAANPPAAPVAAAPPVTQPPPPVSAPAPAPQAPAPAKPAAPRPAPPPVVAAAPPATLHPAHPHAKGEVAAVPPNGPRHKRRAASEAPPGGPWLVQVGAFHTEDPAREVADKLVRHGWKARTVHGRNGWVLVEIAGYKDRPAAEDAARKLAANEHVPTLVRQLARPAADPDR